MISSVHSSHRIERFFFLYTYTLQSPVRICGLSALLIHRIKKQERNKAHQQERRKYRAKGEYKVLVPCSAAIQDCAALVPLGMCLFNVSKILMGQVSHSSWVMPQHPQKSFPSPIFLYYLFCPPQAQQFLPLFL